MVYDLIIVGGGPAGYLAAERAGHEGLSVLLVEKSSVGGVCLNEGCIPTKTFLYSAKILDNARSGEKYGVTAANAALDHKAVVKRKAKVVRTLVAGVKMQLKASNVELVEGLGLILGKNSDGFEVKAGDATYTGKKLLLATGSQPVIPPISGVRESIEKGFVLTNREILDIEEVPQALVVVGGGVIGLEMASYFNSAGSKVTVIEMLDHIAGSTDRQISELLMKNYQKKGIVFSLQSKVVEIRDGNVAYELNGEKHIIAADKVLMSIGRRPATEGLGLENIGVETVRGAIKADDRGRTNVPGVFAAGDVNGCSMLAHTAYREAEVCVNNMLGKEDIMDYCSIPSIIYTNPEVAGAGETEETARQKGIDFVTATVSMRYSGRYLAENEGGDGICKVLADRKNHTLLGVHMIGNYSSEIIYGAALMVQNKMRIEDIKKLVFPHPTVGEVIREAIYSIDFTK